LAGQNERQQELGGRDASCDRREHTEPDEAEQRTQDDGLLRTKSGVVAGVGLALRVASGTRGQAVVRPMVETGKLDTRAAQSE